MNPTQICQSLKKEAHGDLSQEMLQKHDRGASKLVYDIVAGYEPESKQQPTVWVFQGESNPTKVARIRSTSKQMIACFSEKLDMSQSYH